MSDKQINPVYVNSIAWADVKRRIQKQLSGLQLQIEADLTEQATAKLRGRIAALKDVLKFEEKPDA